MQKAEIFMFCKNTNLRSLSVSSLPKRKAGNTKLVSLLLFTLLLCVGNSYTYAQTDSAVLDIKNDTTHLLTVLKSGKVGVGTGTPSAQLHTLGTVRFAKFKNNTYEDSVLTTDVNGNVKLVRKEKAWGGTVVGPLETKFVSTYDPGWTASINFGGYNMVLSVKDTTNPGFYQGLELNNEEKYFELTNRYNNYSTGIRTNYDDEGDQILSLYAYQLGGGNGINISPGYIQLKGGFNNPTGSNKVLTTDANGYLTFVSKPGFDWNNVYAGAREVKFKETDGVNIGKIGWGPQTMYMYAGDSTRTDAYQKLYLYSDESTFGLESRNGQRRTAVESETMDGAYLYLRASDETGSKSIDMNPGTINIGGSIVVDNNGALLYKLHNNSAGDSVLTTDATGRLKLKALSLNKFPTLKNNLAGDSVLTTDVAGNLKLIAKGEAYNWKGTYTGPREVNFSSDPLKGRIAWQDGSGLSLEAWGESNGELQHYQNLTFNPLNPSFELSTENFGNGNRASVSGDSFEPMLDLTAKNATQQNGILIRPDNIKLWGMHNNAAGDSVLTTDAEGNLRFKYLSSPKQQDSTWASDGINAFNKNSGNIGIGTQAPTAKLHTLGSVRFESFKNNPQNDSVLTTDQNGNLRFVYMPYGSGGGGGGTSYSFQNGITQFNGNVSLGGQLLDSVKINLSGHPFSINNGGSRVWNVSSDGNMGIGANADPIYKMYVDGDVNIGHQYDTVGRGSKLFFGGYGNTDAFYMQRYNIRSDVSELRVNIGDDGFTGDRFHVGYVGAGTNTWYSSFVVETTGKAGIGTDELTGQLSIGKDHGVKLSVGNSQWPQSAIIRTGYDNTNGDYTDVLVPGAATNSSMIRLNQAGNVGIGTLMPDATYKLSVNGRIRAKGLRVQSANWSDFVFEPDYKLLSLAELEKFIKANKHLPEIPTTQDVMKDGQEVGEIQSKLLQKIEELTLYTIELNKQVKTLEEKNKKLEDQQKQIDLMQQQLEALKKLISK